MNLSETRIKKISEAETKLGNLKPGKLKDYKSNPGDFNSAAAYAVTSAKKFKAPMLVVPGNSYGSAVFHILKDGEDLKKVTVMKPQKGFAYAKVHPNGDVFRIVVED